MSVSGTVENILKYHENHILDLWGCSQAISKLNELADPKIDSDFTYIELFISKIENEKSWFWNFIWKTQMRNYKMLNKNFTKFKPMIFLKFLNLSDRTKSSSMRKFNHIHRNHFFKINIQITQIMVFRISIFENCEISVNFHFRFS